MKSTIVGEIDKEKLTEEFEKVGFILNEKFSRYEITRNTPSSGRSEVVAVTVYDSIAHYNGCADIYTNPMNSNWCLEQAKIALEILHKTPFRKKQ